MMLLGSLVNMLAIFAGCFVGVTLGRFIPERFNSAIEKGIALCVFYIGLDGVLAGSDTLVAILSMVLGVILGELLDLDGRIHALGDWVERRFAKKQSKTSISEGFVNASLLFCVGAMTIMGALDSGLTGDHATLYAKSTLDGITSIVYGSTMGAGVALSGVAVFLYQGLITLCASFIAPFPPVRPPAAFAHYRLPGGKDSGASFGKIRKLLPSGNPFLLLLAWRRDLPRRGAAVIFRRLLFSAVAFLISLGKAGILQRQVRRRGEPFVRFFRLPEEKRP